MDRKINHIPKDVLAFCLNFEGWVVGGAIPFVLGKDKKEPRDYDIMIPYHTWPQAAMHIPKGTPANTFGGFKIIKDNLEIDVWPDELGALLIRATKQIEAYHLKSDTLVSQKWRCFAEEKRWNEKENLRCPSEPEPYIALAPGFHGPNPDYEEQMKAYKKSMAIWEKTMAKKRERGELEFPPDPW